MKVMMTMIVVAMLDRKEVWEVVATTYMRRLLWTHQRSQKERRRPLTLTRLKLAQIVSGSSLPRCCSGTLPNKFVRRNHEKNSRSSVWKLTRFKQQSRHQKKMQRKSQRKLTGGKSEPGYRKPLKLENKCPRH